MKSIEKIVRNILIVLTFISLIITFLNFTYLTYQDRNIDLINDFLVNYVNNAFVFIDNFLVIIFAIIYVVLGIKSKKEVVLKIAFSVFSILTTMVVLTFIINFLASLFNIL